MEHAQGTDVCRAAQRDAHRSSSGAVIFLLLAGFAMLCMLVVAVGARVYRDIETTAERNFNARTALSYVAGKVRGCDAANGVTTFAQEDGSAVLALGESVDGRDYCTYIFCRDGELCEYFGLRERGFDPKLGEKLVAASAFDLTRTEEGLLTIRITDGDGCAHALALYVQSGGGGAS